MASLADWRPFRTLVEEVHRFPRHGDACASIREGDLLFLRWDRCFPSACIAACNRGASHVALVLANPDDGRLYVAHSTRSYMNAPSESVWKQTDGGLVHNGVHAHLIADTVDQYKHLWILRPTTPFTRTQLQNMTAFLQACIDKGTPARPSELQRLKAEGVRPMPPSLYEDSHFAAEYWHGCFGWANATDDKLMCTETVAEMLRAGGLWPPNEYTTTTPMRMRRLVPGAYFSVF